MENSSNSFKIEFYPEALPKQRISRVKKTTSIKSSSNLTKNIIRACSRNSATTPKLIRKRSSATTKIVREKANPLSPALDIDSLINQMEVSRSNCNASAKFNIKASGCDTVPTNPYMKSNQQAVPVSERENIIIEDEYDPTHPQVKYVDQTLLQKKCNTDSYNRESTISKSLNSNGEGLTEDEYDPTRPTLKYSEQMLLDQMEIIRSYSRKVNTLPIVSTCDIPKGTNTDSYWPDDEYDPMRPQIKYNIM